MKKITDTFYCIKLGCAGYTYNACLIRRQSKKVSSSKNFEYPACAECEQGDANLAGFPKWKYTKPSKKKRPDRVLLRTFKAARAKKEYDSQVSLKEKESPARATSATKGGSTAEPENITFSPEIGKMFDMELFLKGQCSYIFSLLREGKKAEAKKRVALLKKEMSARGYEKQLINDILKGAV